MSIFSQFSQTKFKSAKRLGRGIAAGGGKTAGRGTKGQKSRTGANRKLPAWFEGGQTPLYRKMAKRRGFNHVVIKPLAITTSLINRLYKDGDTVSPASLAKKNLLKLTELNRAVKVIGGQPLTVKVTFEGVKLSRSLATMSKPTTDARNTTSNLEKPRSKK